MRFENQVFDNTTVTLDDNVFVGCTIRNSRIKYSGGIYTLVETTIENPKLLILGRAARTVALLQLFRSHYPQMIDMLLDPATVPMLSEVG